MKRLDLETLESHAIFPADSAPHRELYTGALANLDLVALDYLTIRDLMTLAELREPAAHAALLLLFAALNEGSLCLPLARPELERQLARFAGEAGTSLATGIRDGLAGDAWDCLVAKPGDDAPKPLAMRGTADRGTLYFDKFHRFESRLEVRLRELLQRPTAPLQEPAELAATLAEVLGPEDDTMAFRFNAEQQRALALALCRPFLVISGGPGTGKTSLVVAILRALVRTGIPAEAISLAAPTGRAAQRLSEAIGDGLHALGTELPAIDRPLLQAEATTLHRLIGHSGNRIIHTPGNPLPSRVVIVDEVSMVDLLMMTHLLESLAPETRLLLIGDKDQLPSVEAGAILAELLPSDAVERLRPATADLMTALLPGCKLPEIKELPPPDADTTVILRRTYRATADILQVARQINQMQVTVFDRLPRLERPEEVSNDMFGLPGCRFCDLSTDTADRWKRLIATWSDWHYGRGQPLPDLPPYHELIARGSSHDLSPPLIPLASTAGAYLRELFTVIGAGRILTVLRQGPFGADGVNDWLSQRLRPLLDPGSRGRYFTGAPIMVVRNDYQRGLYNGDIGVVMAIAGRRYRAIFARPDGFHTYSLHTLPGLELAFANTVHKSQGSEYERVLLGLPPVPEHRLLSKEILYTGLTRARSLAVIAATPEAFQYAVRTPVRRYSGLHLSPDPPPPRAAGAPSLATIQGLPLFTDNDG